MRKLSLFVSLYVFWLILSGEFTPFLMTAGLICCAISTGIAARMGIVDAEGHPVHRTLGFLGYIPWLLKEIVVANIDVARRVWSPRLRIDPRLFEIPCNTRTAVGTVTYANSITLTPGTVTVKVNEGSLLIHSLTREGEDALRTGAMHDRVLRLEGTPKP